MKQYLLFGGTSYFGGWSDFLSSHDTYQFKIIRVINEDENAPRKYLFEEKELTWYQIVDSDSGEVLKEYKPV